MESEDFAPHPKTGLPFTEIYFYILSYTDKGSPIGSKKRLTARKYVPMYLDRVGDRKGRDLLIHYVFFLTFFRGFSLKRGTNYICISCNNALDPVNILEDLSVDARLKRSGTRGTPQRYNALEFFITEEGSPRVTLT